MRVKFGVNPCGQFADRIRLRELRAALSLAKLYQSTGRPIDAHAVLAPAREGFSPTPEFPAIADAMEFVAAIKAKSTRLLPGRKPCACDWLP